MDNEKSNREYNIGLDIGTSSVGWAVVESNTQKIIKKGKSNSRKSLWGIRIFDEAETAEKRRTYRSSRRRYDRRRERIKLLREEFKYEIDKVEPDFFDCLQEGFLNETEDINIKYKNNPIFKDFMLNNYQKVYPTIYHLRKELIENDEKKDIRLVYLAIHHIIKYRGNFNYDGSFQINDISLIDYIRIFFEHFKEKFNIENGTEEDYKKINEALLVEAKNDRKIELKKSLSFLNNSDIDYTTPICNALLGYAFDLKKLFQLEIEEKDLKIDFKSDKYDKFIEGNFTMEDDCLELLAELKNLYDSLLLTKLFKNSSSKSISNLMYERYKTHHDDLKELKSGKYCLRENKEAYKKIFRDTTKMSIYSKYVHNKCTYDELINELKKYVIFTEKDEKRIDNEEYLPRLTSTENGIFPYQLNKDELIKIILNQGKYYPFLLSKIDSEYRIEKILSYKIPYYVGPLNRNSRYSWFIRKEGMDNIKITPFNFNEIIDKEKTAEEFIGRMLGTCTYLVNEPSMPTNSILYSEFKVLNELKQIKINNGKLTCKFTLDEQHNIYKNLFLKVRGPITEKKFKNFLKESNIIVSDELKITGYSALNKFANDMNPYIDFFGKNGIFEFTDYNESDAEKIIEWITIYNDKDILKSRVMKEYPLLDDSKVKLILNKKYTGWSSLSRKLLTGISIYNNTDSTYKNIMELLYETEENFMQLLYNDKYKIQEEIDKINSNNMDYKKISYSLVEDLPTSPKNKRGIYQALKIVDEIVKYMGYNPKNISVEFARSEEIIKKRTNTRYKYLKTIYDKLEKEYKEYGNLCEELKEYADKNKEIDDKLYLYFIQEGRCLYSGTPINLADLYNDSLLEVDHILPRTLIKDNSFDNKALVYRKYNQDKKDSLILPKEYRDKCTTWWSKLKDKNLLTNTKFYRLTRSKYTDEDVNGFINRQLVETRQICKHVANILRNIYEDTNVIYLKADLSHNYREAFKLYKFRDINDYHHAHDAYLAAVLGEYRCKVFNKENKFSYELAKDFNRSCYKNKDYSKLKYGYALSLLQNNDYIYNNETGEVLFDVEKFNKTVINTLYRNDILFTKKTSIKSGKYYDETIYSKNDKEASIPLKKNLPISIYGGYSSKKPAYAVMVEFTKKGKTSKKMIGYPIYAVDDKKRLDGYIRETLKLTENDPYKINNTIIPFNSLFNWNGQICYLVGASDTVEVCNAMQFKYDKKSYIKFKDALYKVFINSKFELDEIEYNKMLDEILNYIITKVEFKYKLYSNLVPDMKNIVNAREYNTMEKENLIKEFHKLLRCNSINANLKCVDEKLSSAFGKKHSRIIESVKLINQSITGIYESEKEI